MATFMTDNQELLAAIDAKLETQAEKLERDQVTPTDDAVQVMNDILLPLIAAVRRGFEGCGWIVDVHGTNTDPTIWIRFRKDHKQDGEIMFYPTTNIYVGYGLASSFSKPGSADGLPLAPLPLKRFHPKGAVLIVRDLVRRALSDQQPATGPTT